MSHNSEVTLGEVRVNTVLTLGSERIRLLFTNNRMIVDHVGKRGAGAVAGANILGKISAAFEDLLRSGGESARRRGVEKLSADQVLRAHKDNFVIHYEEVVSVKVSQNLALNHITILTADDKFEFSTRTRMDAVIELFEKTLKDKLTVYRLTQVAPRR